MDSFEWQRARTLHEAAVSATHTTAEAMVGPPQAAHVPPQAVLVKAGGVDIVDLMKDGLVRPRRLVDIGGLSELQGIREEPDGGLRIGALTTLAQIAEQGALRGRFEALAEAAATAASPQIRNRATLGGNLVQRPRCWYLRSAAHVCVRKGGDHCFAYAGDSRYHAVFDNGQGCAIVHPSTLATALAALEAQVQWVDRQGAHHSVPIEGFFVLPGTDPYRETILQAGDLVTAVTLPGSALPRRSAYVQVSEKPGFDWPLAAVAAMCVLDERGVCRHARVVLGAAAPVPWIVRQAGPMLEGAHIAPEAAQAVAQAAIAQATPLSGNAYKVELFRTLIARAIVQAGLRA